MTRSVSAAKASVRGHITVKCCKCAVNNYDIPTLSSIGEGTPMPKIRSLSEFNRNQIALIDELRECGEPMYLTRNGRAAVVVMDADAFDRFANSRDVARENEMRIYESLMEGYRDYLEGRVVDADEAHRILMEEKGW